MMASQQAIWASIAVSGVDRFDHIAQQCHAWIAQPNILKGKGSADWAVSLRTFG